MCSSDLLQLEGAAALTGANKRIANILRKSDAPASVLEAHLFELEAERSLAAAVAAVTPVAQSSIVAKDYSSALRHLATLRPAVDAFFDGVMVNAEDAAVRRNRLALLSRVQQLFLEIADLSRLPG